MTFPLRFAPGIIFDLRHVFLILAGPFGGLPAALLTAAATGGLRFLEGGVGLYPGLAGIAISTTIGLGFAWLNGNRDYTLAKVSLLGLLSSVSITSLFVLPLPIAMELLGRISIPIIIVNFVGVLIAAESLNRFRVQMHREESLARDSSTDPLTGLSNRRAFDVQGPELALNGIQKKGRYALMIIDIDRFKSINDTFGHASGDKVLKQVADAIASHARDDDLVVRYGGEEIALVLPGCDETRTAMIADRIREGIENSTVEVSGINLKVTVSIGYVVVDKPGMGFWSAFEQADSALYRAKNAGRNRVEKALAERANAA